MALLTRFLRICHLLGRRKSCMTVNGMGLKVDILVNGAGLGGAGDTFEHSIELAERMTVLNCISLVQLSQLFGGDMIKRGRGWMLQISSVGGMFRALMHID